MNKPLLNVTIQLFAAAREIAGSSSVTLSLPSDATVADLRRELVKERPQLEALSASLLVAVNNAYANDDSPLTNDANIAVFPPVSGG